MIAILKEKWCNEDAHAWLEQVNNATGWRGGRQYADAIVCSCWPSRGLWLAGIEVKVSRSDWLSELRKPAKSAEIQGYCRYWWVAAPEGVVLPSEVPDAWGWLEVYPNRKRDRYKVKKQAPQLEEKPLTMAFVASVIRSQAKVVTAAFNRGHYQALVEVKEKHNEIRQLERRVDQAEFDATDAQSRLDDFTKTVREFEEAAGIRKHQRRRKKAESELAEAESNLERVRDLLAELRPQARRLAADMEEEQFPARLACRWRTILKLPTAASVAWALHLKQAMVRS